MSTTLPALDAGRRLWAMAVHAPPAVSMGTSQVVPYPPSWVDRLTARLDWSVWSFWLVIGIGSGVGVGAMTVLGWLERGQIGTFDAYFVLVGLLPFYELALIRHLDRVAADALDRFRPLLDIDEAAFAELHYRITTLPARPALVVPLVTAMAAVIDALNNPAAHRIDGVAPGLAVVHLALEAVPNMLYVTLVLKILRYLRDVDRIHRQADRVNLLDPGPIYAFSRLTSQAALGMLVPIAVLVLTGGGFQTSASESTRLAIGFSYAVIVAMAIGSFVLPLEGMHHRLVVEKVRLQSASSARLTALLAELDRDVTGLSLARADGLNKLLASVLSERELIARLPTWPWQAATLRAFVSALLLPVAVYVLARVAERVVL